MIDAILFDFGGTLDTNGIHWSEMFWDIYETNSIPVSKEECAAAFVYGEKEVKRKIEPYDDLQTTFFKKTVSQFEYLQEKNIFMNVDANSINAIVKDALRISYENIDHSRRLLKELRSSYKLGVVSNYTGNLKTVLKETGIYNFLDTAVDSVLEKIYKPDPKLYGIGIERVGVEPEGVMVVGDSYKNDITPSKKLGCSTVWLDVKSWTSPASTKDADFIIKTLDEVTKVLREFE